jgi:hypothetical protein
MMDTTSATTSEVDMQDRKPIDIFREAAPDVRRTIRVALYDEANGTQPAYASVGSWTTNVTPVDWASIRFFIFVWYEMCKYLSAKHSREKINYCKFKRCFRMSVLGTIF